ncbi:hypothetical protein CLV67_104497 [Actinoplanes italicus]|uniref:Uncharacterized protein n=1 Tax=Actinoplanes italicus TaxID=113567 RepID=A0A2T0KHP5_9ACTN|nr:hypothetical protein CLV67_104497 [Actinoplanes italicus]
MVAPGFLVVLDGMIGICGGGPLVSGPGEIMTAGRVPVRGRGAGPALLGEGGGPARRLLVGDHRRVAGRAGGASSLVDLLCSLVRLGCTLTGAFSSPVGVFRQLVPGSVVRCHVVTIPAFPTGGPG